MISRIFCILFVVGVFCSCHNEDLQENDAKEEFCVVASVDSYSGDILAGTRYYIVNQYYDIPAEGEDTLLLRDFTKISNKGVLQNLGLLLLPSHRVPKYNVLFTTDIESPTSYGWQNNLFAYIMSCYLPSFSSAKWDGLTTTFPTYLYDVNVENNDSAYVFGVSDKCSDVVFGGAARSGRARNRYEMKVRHQGVKLCILLYNGAKVNPATPELTYDQQKVWLTGYKEMAPGLAFVKDEGTYNYVVPDNYTAGLSALPDNLGVSGAKAVYPTWTPKGTVNDSLPIPFVKWGTYRAFARLIAPQADISNMAIKVKVPQVNTLDNLTPQIYTLPLTDIKLDNGTNLSEFESGKLYYIKVYVSLLEGVEAKASIVNWNSASTATNIEMVGTDDAFISK